MDLSKNKYYFLTFPVWL